VRIAMLLSLSLAVLGCGDDCHEGESQCDGSLILTCDEGDLGGYMFRGLGDCCAGSTCRDVTSGSDRVAVCSDSPDPDSRCPMFGTICADATTLLQCSYGYSRPIETCGACVDPGDGSAFCAQAADDPSCAGVSPDGATCSGTTLVRCDGGARLDQTACSVACIDLGSGNAFCTTSAQPDPRCPSMGTWCDGNVAMICTTGGYLEVQTCDASQSCYVPTLPDGTVIASAFCNTPGMPSACAAD
jgi:hypothetical protein